MSWAESATRARRLERRRIKKKIMSILYPLEKDGNPKVIDMEISLPEGIEELLANSALWVDSLYDRI